MTIDQIIILSTAVISNNQKEILFLKRSKNSKTFKGYWQLPEGRIEKDESPIKALTREVKEEIGCKITKVKLYSIVTVRAKVKEVSYLLFKAVFSAEYRGRIKLGSEHSTYIWLSKNKAVKTLNLVPGTLEILREL